MDVKSSPLLSRPGAVAGDGADSGVAAHYGDPLREQRDLARGVGTVDRSHRGVISVTGPDRLSWLHSLITQHVEKLAPGEWVQALVLDPQGHVEHHLCLGDDGETTWIHVEPGAEAGLLAWLDSMRFMLRVEVRDRTLDFAVVSSAHNDRLIPRSELASLAGPLAGLAAYEALRVADVMPRIGVDSDERSIPNESRWLIRAVHLDKGCYRGQETVARVANLGQPPRRTLLLHLDGSADRLPAPGSPIEAQGRAIGTIGSVARHYELGAIGIGLIKRAAADQLIASGDPEVVVDGIGGRLEPDDLQAPTARAERPSLMRF